MSARRVDFYVTSGTEERSRFKLACKLTEQAYLAGERVLVCFDEPQALGRFDELLWTYADRSFVPHEIFADAAQWQDTPVLLCCGSQPRQPFDLLVNLGDDVPAAAGHASRIAELIDGDEGRRRAGRNRFRQYREQGLTPETHSISGDDALQDSPLR
ncbi:MAG: DNA polymerase III subunit chi [Steroidobacteraceae bacterium]